MFEVIKNLPKWAKILGISAPIGLVLLLVALLIISHQPGGQAVVNAPTTVEAIKQNATDLAISAGINASEESAPKITSSFHQMGENLASTVKDPNTKKSIISLSDLAGFFLAAFVVIAIIGGILASLGIKIKGVNS